MTPHTHPTTPAWAAGRRLPSASAPEADLDAEVCVVGAGVGGLTAALLLAREGRRVVVLDAGRPGGGESARTTAHLSNAIDDRYARIIASHGREGARLAAESHGAAIDRIEAFARELGADCDFRRLDGFLFAADPAREAGLDEERAAAREAGLVETDFCAWPGGAGGPRCLRFRHQAQVTPWPYLRGLADEFVRLGGRLHGDTRVTEFDEGARVRVVTEGGREVRADALVVATNSPVNDRFALHTKIAPYRTYAVALRVPAGAVPPGLYWDNASPYHYVRLAPAADGEGELLIVGGEDRKTGQDSQAESRFQRLVDWARERFPAVGEAPPEHCWSGQVMETVDGLAYLGRNPGSRDNIHVITGDSGMGMTHGTLGGMIVSDLILGRANPWGALYDPGRTALRGPAAFAEENLNVARQYLSWLRRDVKDDPDVLPPGAGIVVQDGLAKVALGRDEAGCLHRLSAVCPHLGCVVAWNPVEHSWDCPCHGSRFAADGSVLNGPAATGLAPAD